MNKKMFLMFSVLILVFVSLFANSVYSEESNVDLEEAIVHPEDANSILSEITISKITIVDVGSSAKSDVFLGVGSEIEFYIKFSEKVKAEIIEPKTYNSKPISWTTDNYIVYYATYKIEEGDYSQEKPLQLGTIVYNLGGENIEYNNKKIVKSLIDAMSPVINHFEIPSINSINKLNFPISISLNMPEGSDNYTLKYSFTDSNNKTISGEISLDPYFKVPYYKNFLTECDANKELLAKGCPFNIYITGLEGLSDGTIEYKINVVDRANNSSKIYSSKMIKDTELLKVKYKVPHINLNNYKNYYIEKYAPENSFKKIKSIYYLFEDEKNQTKEFNTLDKFDLSSLEEGKIKLSLKFIDEAGNETMVYQEVLQKDLEPPIFDLNKDIFINENTYVINKLMIKDKINEKIEVQYTFNKTVYNCNSIYIPGNDDSGKQVGFTEIKCVIDDLDENINTVEFVAKDPSGNETKSTLNIYVNTKKYNFKFIDGEIEYKKGSEFPYIISGVLEVFGLQNINSLQDSVYKISKNYFEDINLNITASLIVPLAGGKPITINDIKFDTNNGQIFIYLKNYKSNIEKEGKYALTLRIKDKYGTNLIKTKQIYYDNTPPTITLNPLSTSNRTPTISGTVSDNLTDVSKVEVTIDGKEYIANINNNEWSVTTETLPIGTSSVSIKAIDQAGNEAELNDSILIYTTGGGRRIYPLDAPAVVEPTPQVETEQPQPQTPTPQPTPSSGTETTTETPIVETVEPEPTFSEIEEETPSGLTGFAGFANSPTGMVTIISGILVILAAIGYFVFTKK